MYLGIDLGTSEVKALVIDENHEVIASHSAPLSIQRPHPHWSEQAPELWWEATEYLMATLRENARSIGRPLRRLASPGRCTARCCWMQREGDPSSHSVERHPLRRRVRRAGGDGAGAASGGGQPGDAGLYRAEAVVGAPSRAAALSAHRHGAVAQGLSALPDDREESLRYVGRRRDAVAGRGEARLVRRSAGQVRLVA